MQGQSPCRSTRYPRKNLVNFSRGAGAEPLPEREVSSQHPFSFILCSRRLHKMKTNTVVLANFIEICLEQFPRTVFLSYQVVPTIDVHHISLTRSLGRNNGKCHLDQGLGQLRGTINLDVVALCFRIAANKLGI